MTKDTFIKKQEKAHKAAEKKDDFVKKHELAHAAFGKKPAEKVDVKKLTKNAPTVRDILTNP